MPSLFNSAKTTFLPEQHLHFLAILDEMTKDPSQVLPAIGGAPREQFRIVLNC